MNIPSPFEGLEIEKELVFEFFAAFSRLEFSLKELCYSRNERGVVSPAWWRFSEEIAENLHVEIGSELNGAITFLCNEPPLVQVGAREWQLQDLHGERKSKRLSMLLAGFVIIYSTEVSIHPIHLREGIRG